ncbi:MAG: hypothetical protein JWL71_1037, partial [Acidobacteria bacterium]|nr:hypothetical protein [Acidobacteriota bacterium]
MSDAQKPGSNADALSLWQLV